MFSGNIYHHRTSAKTGQGIEACFTQLISKIWTNLNMKHYEESGKTMSAYSGSVESSQDTMFQFKPVQVRQKMKKTNLLSSMDNYVDGSNLKADAIFDDDNSKDLYRRNNAFNKHSITSDKGFFGLGEQSFKLNKIDHHKYYKRYNQDNSSCCFGGGGCCESDNTEKNLID